MFHLRRHRERGCVLKSTKRVLESKEEQRCDRERPAHLRFALPLPWLNPKLAASSHTDSVSAKREVSQKGTLTATQKSSAALFRVGPSRSVQLTKPITLPRPVPIPICISKTHLRNATSGGQPSPPTLPQPSTQPRAPEPPVPGTSAGRSPPRAEGHGEMVARPIVRPRAAGPDPWLRPVAAQRVWNKSPRHRDVSRRPARPLAAAGTGSPSLPTAAPPAQRPSAYRRSPKRPTFSNPI